MIKNNRNIFKTPFEPLVTPMQQIQWIHSAIIGKMLLFQLAADQRLEIGENLKIYSLHLTFDVWWSTKFGFNC